MYFVANTQLYDGVPATAKNNKNLQCLQTQTKLLKWRKNQNDQRGIMFLFGMQYNFYLIWIFTCFKLESNAKENNIM